MVIFFIRWPGIKADWNDCGRWRYSDSRRIQPREPGRVSRRRYETLKQSSMCSADASSGENAGYPIQLLWNLMQLSPRLLHAAYGHLLSGGLVGTVSGSTTRSKSLKMTQSFNRQSMVSHCLLMLQSWSTIEIATGRGISHLIGQLKLGHSFVT